MEEDRGREEVLETELREFLRNVENDSFRERLIRLLLNLPREHWSLLEDYTRQLLAESQSARAAPPAPLTPGEADAESEYEKSSGYAQAMGLSASNTTSETSVSTQTHAG